MTPRRWTRRGALVLGLSAVGVGLPVNHAPAAVETVTLGDVHFEVPSEVRPAPVIPGITWAWPWQGASPTAPGAAPAIAVLARADIDSTDAGEVLGLLLAGAVDGQLPGLATQSRRARTLDADQGDQLRVDLDYVLGRRQPYRGTLLITTRARPPAAVLVVLGDDTLTAGQVDRVLDSLRWTS